jgi:hypothetical protein
VIRFTPTEQRIYDTLRDGRSHPKKDLQQLLYDEMSNESFRMHLCQMRKKIRPIGQDIITEFWMDGIYHRLVRFVSVS